jgi:CelD/BcsL family acetyltransferase involved in cellulose biosynthesis
LGGASEWLGHPFLAPEFAVALADRPGARVAVLSEGTEHVGFLAYERTGLGVGRPLARGLNIGQGLVHHPELRLPERTLLKACGLSVLEYDNWVPDSTAVALRGARRVDLPVVDFSCGWDEYLKGRHDLHRKYFRTIDYKRRKLEREVGPVEVRAVSGPGGGGQGALATLLAWKSRQYRLSGWPDPFADPAVREAVERVAALDCAAVRAVFTTVRARGRLIAVDLSLTSGTVFAGWVQAHDPEFGRYSPGMIRTVETLRAAARLGVGHVALGRNDEGYKRYLKNDDLFVLEGRARRAGPVAGMYAMRHGPVARAKRAVLAHPRARAAVRAGLARYGAARERWHGRG